MEGSLGTVSATSNLLLLNARSLSPAGDTCWKLGLIRDYVRTEKTPTIAIAVTETWFKGYHSDAQVEIPGYSVYRSDRESRVGGGCALYVHSSLAVSDSTCFASVYNNMKAVYVGQINTIFVAVYRSDFRVKCVGFSETNEQTSVIYR